MNRLRDKGLSVSMDVLFDLLKETGAKLGKQPSI
jgi:hypothetical protein